MKVIYDIECFNNLFLYGIHNIDTNEKTIYEVSFRRDDRRELYSFLNKKIIHIGYNNLGYDYPLTIKFLLLYKQNLKLDVFLSLIKKESNRLIKTDRFNKLINLIPQVDLMKLWHYDRKKISLKHLQVVMELENVQELPFEHFHVFTKESEIGDVITYLHNDLYSTYEFYLMSRNEIQSRANSSKRYHYNMMNMNAAKLGETIFSIILSKELGIEEFGRTILDKIELKDVIFDYIEFNTEPFQKLLEFFKCQVVTDLKGAFVEIPYEDMEILEGYYVKKDKKTKGDPIPKQKDLNIIYDGVKLVYGSGGVHGSRENYIIEEDDEWCILDADVKSFYPNLAIKNNYWPKHLPEQFCHIYKEKYDERASIPKSNSLNLDLKLMLNAVYGKSNEENSIFFDSSYTLTTTINGQLLISRLVEDIIENSQSSLIQINTDGASFKVKRTELDHVKQITSNWETYSKGLELEVVEYQKMIIKNVNSYIWISKDGKVKRKKDYEYERLPEKNPSMKIVPKAVEAYYLHGTPIEEFIKNHKNIHDFFKIIKVDKNCKIITESEDSYIEYQKLNRYLVTNDGHSMFIIRPPLLNESKRHDPKYALEFNDPEKYYKKFEPRRFSVEKDFLVTVCNNLKDFVIDDLFKSINYDYYIDKANKLLIE